MRTIECPRCKAVALKAEPSTIHSYIVEWYCEECGHYETHTNPLYDPSPEEQEDVTRIGGWG